MVNYPSNEQITEMLRQLHQARIENWLGHQLGSWRWWTLLVLLIVPWFVWYKLADKKKLPELALFGLIVMVFAITLDELGARTLWSYPVFLIPWLPRFIPINYTVLPISYTLIYQYFPSWKRFFWALIVLSGAFSFLVEPLITYLGFYILVKWSHWYSFIAYIVIGLLSRWIIRMFYDIALRS